MIAYKSDERIFHSQPILYVLLFGLVAAKITNRLVVSINSSNLFLFSRLLCFQVAHMCKGEISHRDATMLAPLVLFLNQYFNTFISEGPLLYLALVWVTLDLMWYCSKVTLGKNSIPFFTTSTFQVCLEICAFLDVRLFTIPHVTVHQAINLILEKIENLDISGWPWCLSGFLNQWDGWEQRAFHKTEEEAQSLLKSSLCPSMMI